MWSFCIVIGPPSLGNFLGFLDVHKPVVVQALVSELSVEGFNERVLDGLAGIDEMQVDSVLLSPLLCVLAPEFRSVVNDNFAGLSEGPDQSVKGSGDARSRKAEVSLNAQAFAGEIVHYVKRAKPTAGIQTVAHKVHRPALVHPGRDLHRRSTGLR